VTQIPIACTLTGAQQKERGDEWRHFLADDVVEVARTDSSARLRLNDESDVILTAVDLARREKACCAFFEFRLDVLDDAIWLVVDAPAEAASILDELISST
jgi:MerR family copper efflux transcriptional regulator